MSQIIWQQITNHSDAPTTCGVYQYWDQDKILYIGKAINLKARLTSHAQNAKLDDKERAIVGGATHIKYTETDNEFLALLLEAELIRQYQPPYNRIWKDDKTYLYIVIDTRDPFPRPRFARAHTIKSTKPEIRNTKLKVFGPFPNTQVAEEVLRVIRRLIPFCMSKKVGRHACFYSKIGLCSPCPNTFHKFTLPKCKILTRQYRKQIFQVIKILSGKIDPVIKDLTHQMNQASASQDFETALILRTKIERFTRFIATHTFRENSTISYNTAEQKTKNLQQLLIENWNLEINLHRVECYDASNSAMHDSTVSMVVATDGLLDRGEYRRFKIKNLRSRSDFDRLAEAITRRIKNTTWPSPDIILLDGGKPQLRAIQPILDQLPNPPLLFGLAKRPDRLMTLQGETLKIDLHQPGFQLLIELRDEAHRFANSYRKILETKRMGAPGRN